MARIIASLLALAAFPGCGNAINCALHGDNLKGRVGFAQSVAIRLDAAVVIQYSTDSFATVVLGSTSQANPQGLVTIPFGICAPSDLDYQLRAFQDLNGHGTPDAGEAIGRDDGTSDGDQAYVVRRVTTNAQGDYNKITDIDITIDVP